MSKLEQLLLKEEVETAIERLSRADIKRFFKDILSDHALDLFKSALAESNVQILGSIILTEYTKYLRETLLPGVEESIATGTIPVSKIRKIVGEL